MYNFTIQLADMDRGVYEDLALKVACHPSETEEYLVTRVLAYCLEFTEGIAFSRGLAEPDVPAISVRDLTGTLTSWIEIGAPDAARLHKASKAAARVAVYTHRTRALLQQLAGERVHRAAELELYAIGGDVLAGLVERLDRRMAFDLSVSDGQIFVSIAGTSLSGPIERLTNDAH